MSAKTRPAAGSQVSPVLMKLCCPSCGKHSQLSTIEQLEGVCRSTFTVAPDGARDVEPHGETDIRWDTSTTVGVECEACGWCSTTAKPWIGQLRPENGPDDATIEAAAEAWTEIVNRKGGSTDQQYVVDLIESATFRAAIAAAYARGWAEGREADA